ncbi:MAG TPA: hypothetical protein VN238_00925 [Solirubrobacteraceae bacterium]|nr:hypothetical protein [Solirubrobacteraceae bacterium]
MTLSSKKLTALALVSSAAVASSGLAYAGLQHPDAAPVKELAGAPAATTALPGPVQQSFTGPAARQAGVLTTSARAIPATDTRPALYISSTADGGACIALASGAMSCGSAESIRTGKFGLTIIDPPANGPAVEPVETPQDGAVEVRPLPGGNMTRYGIAPNGVSKVVARSALGRESAAVTSNVYKLDLGHEGRPDQADSVELVQTDGTATRYSLR